jgi:GWxTD domain-containing protein
MRFPRYGSILRRRSSLILAVWLLGAGLCAFQTVVETIGRTTRVVLLSPFSEYGLDRPDQRLESVRDVSLVVLDRKDRIADQRKIRDRRHRPDPRFAGGLAFSSFDFDLTPGTYRLFVRITDAEGILREETRRVVVPKKSRRDGVLYRLWIASGEPILCNEPPTGPTTIDSCRVMQLFSARPDSLFLNAGARRFTLDPTRELSYDASCDSTTRTPTTIARFGKRVVTSSWRPVTPGFLIEREIAPETQRFILQYFLTASEMKVLRKSDAETLPSDIDALWLTRDPSPGTIANEARDAFYKRVHAADSLYGTPGFNHGWETDMGHVYIKYGPPDSTGGDPLPSRIAPYIIWEYSGLGKTFVFRDRKGYGVYELESAFN